MIMDRKEFRKFYSMMDNLFVICMSLFLFYFIIILNRLDQKLRHLIFTAYFKYPGI